MPVILLRLLRLIPRFDHEGAALVAFIVVCIVNIWVGPRFGYFAFTANSIDFIVFAVCWLLIRRYRSDDERDLPSEEEAALLAVRLFSRGGSFERALAVACIKWAVEPDLVRAFIQEDLRMKILYSVASGRSIDAALANLDDADKAAGFDARDVEQMVRQYLA